MANFYRESDDAPATTSSSHNTVFIDTNLDTHLALIVSDSDTVSDLKKKIMSEHPQCFPNFGVIKVRALKVKRKRLFYHLSDSMLVKSAFEGAKKCLFLSADAFSLKQHDDNQYPIEPDPSNQLALICCTKTPSGDLYASHPGVVSPEASSDNTGKEVLNDMEMINVDVGEEPCKVSYPDINMRSDSGEIHGTHVEFRNDESRDDILVEASKSQSVAKKKQKRESKGAGNPLEENMIILSTFNEETTKPKDKIPNNSVKDKLKTTTSTSDSLFNKPPEVAQLVASSYSGKKKSKKKNKSPRDEVVIAEPLQDKASDAPIVSEQNVQHAAVFGTFEVPQKQKNPEPIQEVVEQDKLPSSSLEDVHVVASASSGKKKSKRESKLPRDLVVNAGPSSLHDVGKETFKENVGIIAKDLDMDAAIVSEQKAQRSALSGTFEVSQKQKHPEPIQEVVERDKLPSSSIEDVHLVASSRSGKKKSGRKNKLPKDQVVNTEPSSLHDVGKERFNENIGIVAEDLDVDAALVSEQNVQHATLSRTFKVPPKQKHPEPIQDVVEQDKVPSSSIEDVQLVAGSSSGKKKTKRKNNDVGKENFKEIVGVVAKDSDKDAAIVSEQDAQHATLLETFEVSQKQKHPESVQEVMERDKLPSSSRDAVRKKKSKRKNEISRDEVVTAEPFYLRDGGKESFKENVGIFAKDLDKASDAAIVSEQTIQHATLSGTFEISQKQKHTEPVQEVVEQETLPSSSIGINASGPDAANEKGKSDAPELGARSRSKGRKNSKQHQSINVKEFTSLTANEFDSLKKDVTLSQHANIAPGDYTSETSHPRKIEELRELPHTHNHEAMLSQKCEPLIQVEANMHSKESVVSGFLLESNTVMESGKSAASSRTKKKAKESVATKQVMASMEHGDNSVSGVSSHMPRFDDHSGGEARKEESFLSPTKRKKRSKPKTMDTSFVGVNGQGDESGNEAESLPLTQINKTQEDAEDIDGNLRKKARKKETSDAKTLADFPVKEQTNVVDLLQLKQINMTRKNAEKMDEISRKKTKTSENSAPKSPLDFPIKEQERGGEELTSSKNRQRQEDTPSETKGKTKSVQTSSNNQSTGRDLELEKYHGSKCGSVHPQQNLVTVELTQAPSSLEGNSIGRPLQYDFNGNACRNSNTTDANYQTRVSEYDGGRINFKDYFVPGEHNHEIAPVELVVDKVSEEKTSEREVKTKKTAKKLVPLSATSLGQRSERRSHGVNAPDSQVAEQVKMTRQGSKQPDVANSSQTGSFVPAYPKENGESSGATSSSTESSDKYHQNKETKRQSNLVNRQLTVSKAFNNKMGEVVNSSRREKSLLATPGTIFRDGSSESSEDESGTVNSDSTKSPSDCSSSSGYSEGESKLNLNTPQNGIHGAKGKDGGKSIIKSQDSGVKSVALDTILRSSSRFKKAKITATQSQLEDTDSQPVDFVPDSQANQ